MPCFHLEKGARFLRMENLKNRSATGIAGRCDRAERHKRRLPLFLQSLRNGAGHPLAGQIHQERVIDSPHR